MFKSIKTGVLALVLVSTAIISHAQKKVSEGSLVYMSELDGKSTEMKYKFSGDISVLKMQQGPAGISIFTDIKNESGLLLVDVPIAQKQYAAKMTKQDIETMRASQPKYSDFKTTGVKEMVAGYNCEKYTYKDDKGNAYELWVTEDIELPLNNMSVNFKEVKGTPVKFSGNGGSIVLKSVKEEKVGELSVSKIPDGYEVMTYAEMMAMSGGGE